MDERQALAAFAALSQETRLQIVRLLVVAGADGMAAGALAERVRYRPRISPFISRNWRERG